MTLVKPCVTVNQKDGICMEVASAGGQKFYIDQPKADGGTGKGMSPVEALLGSLGACMNMVTLHLARMQQIPISHLSVKVEGDLDLSGKPRPGLQQIRLDYEIESSAAPETVKALVAEASRHCPVDDTLQHGTQVVLNGVEVK